MSLTDLPPELLAKVVDACAADLAHGRAALLSFSVMSKYIRSVTKSRLFERISFGDSPHSPGDEILHSIRLFMAAPGLRDYVQSVSLCLKRVRHLSRNPASCPSEPYHYLVLPELMEALAATPKVTELSIKIEGGQGTICLEGLRAAARWVTAREQLNIKSLTVSLFSKLAGDWPCDVVYNDNDFLEIFPQLTALCLEGTDANPVQVISWSGSQYRTTIASHLTHLRLCKSSHPRSGVQGGLWWEYDIPSIDFARLTPQLEHLSILGELGGPSVSYMLSRLSKIPMLKYLDVTDEHMNDDFQMPQDRSVPAEETFQAREQLRRIVFIRKGVGEVYLRGYCLPVADSTGYISEDVNDADTGEIPIKWCHGIPQTTLTPFPSFNPWKGR